MKSTIKSRKLAAILESHGWQGKRNSSSHIVYRHENFPKVLSFPLKSGGEEIRTGLLVKLERLSGLKLRN